MEPLKGLITAPNTLQTDPYSVITADDVVVDIGGYLRTREGQKQTSELAVNSRISSIIYDGTYYYYFLENGSIYKNSSLIGSNYTIPDLKIGAQALLIDKMVYANLLEQNYTSFQQLAGGIKIYSTIGKQGCPRPVIAAIQKGTIYTNYDDWASFNDNEALYNSVTPAYTSVLSAQISSCAYCCTLEYIDDNGRLVESEPSNVITRTFYNNWNSNPTTPSFQVVNSLFNQFKVFCYDANIIDVNRRYKLNVYRTEIFTVNKSYYNWVTLNNTSDYTQYIGNDRQFFLIDTIDQSNFLSVSTGTTNTYYYVYTDKTKKGAYTKRALYSNSNAALQNSNVGIHKVFGKFKEYYIFGNIQNKISTTINLKVPWNSGTSYSTPQVSDTLSINLNSYNMSAQIINYSVIGAMIGSSSGFTGTTTKVYNGNFSGGGSCNTFNENGLVSELSNILYTTSTQYNDVSLLNSIMFNNPNGGYIPFLTAQSLTLEKKDFFNGSQQIYSSGGSNFLDTTGTSNPLNNIFYANRIYYSKFQEPDSVPRLNYLDVGDGSNILAVKQLRQSLFIFKENDGVYILRGNTPDDWSLLRLYPDLRLVAPRTLVVMEDSIIGLFNVGIVAVSENGFDILSKDIKDIIDPLTRSATPEKQWGVDDKTNRRYYAFIDVGTNGSKPYVFDFYTNSWTHFTYERNAGVYANGKLITSLLENGVNKIYEQETDKYVDTNLLGVETKINSSVEYRKFTGDQFVLSKTFKDISLFFRTNNFNRLKVSYKTNYTNSYYTYTISLIKNLTYTLGNVIRSLVPREYSRGNWLGVKLETDPTVAVIDKTKPEFTLEGVEVFYNKTTNKT